MRRKRRRNGDQREMTVSCFPTGIVNRERPGQGVADIRRTGFTHVVLDYSLYCTEDDLEYAGKKDVRPKSKCAVWEHPGELTESMSHFIQKCSSEGLEYSFAVMPYLRRNTEREDMTQLLGELARECIKDCGKAGCGALVVRPLFAGIDKELLWEVNREFYLSLVPLAREHQVTILLENLCKDINGHLVRGICSDGREAATWVDRLNAEAGEKCFGFCMDVGVCNLCGQNMYDYVLELGSRIKAVILCDCNGNTENAMLPFTCVNKRTSQTDWLNLIRGLREVGFDGQLALDLSGTAAAFSPMLRPALLQLAVEVAKFFEWQIGLENLLRKYKLVVLFGAGNMCRNYMKCYGEKYMPLFTCDNNKSLWGTSFCGLEVRPPESLLEIPKDCAVFICNVFYREIEKQLRDMGLQNPIEYFNDEYMPTFYFDRLEDGGKRA